MQRYAITDRKLFAAGELFLARVASWAREGVDYIQIREKDLAPPALTALAAQIVAAVRQAGSHTSVLLNGPAEIASAAGCDGVHLPSGLPVAAIAEARSCFRESRSTPVISISCHALQEVTQAREAGADLILFAPVFEKRVGSSIIPGIGLTALAEACRAAAPIPVFALGGVTAANTQSCLSAGASGVAAIRMFTVMHEKGESGC